MSRDSFVALEKALNASFLEREDEVHGLMLGLLSRQHVLFLGDPGTAKSAMCESLCASIQGAEYFRYLLTKFTTPEEIFGSLSLKQLEQDKYVRNTEHKLPEARICFLDEVWKASSAILNSLLTIANEREFSNGNGRPQKVPLEIIVGASNEMPEDDELNALWDRFLFRYSVDYVRDRGSFKRLLNLDLEEATYPDIDEKELETAQTEVKKVALSKELPDRIVELKEKLSNDFQIEVSDRRWQWGVKALKAEAWLDGRGETIEDDIACLWPILWQEPAQIQSVRQLCMGFANPFEERRQRIEAELRDLERTLKPTGNNANDVPAGTEGMHKVSELMKRAQALFKEQRAAKKDTEKIERTFQNLAKAQKFCTTEMLKVPEEAILEG